MGRKIKHNAIVLTLLVLACDILQAQQTEKIYLSGKGNDNTVSWEFYCTGGMNSGRWTTIQVPSCWELQGFGKYDYGFAKDSVRGKEKGMYKHSFTVPSSWKEKKVNIVFEGVMTDAEVKVNGQPAGPVHQGAFYAFKYDISRLLQYGKENLLEVIVAKHSANESVNAAERRADFWIFGGIFRPVWLEVLPQIHIETIAIDAKANGVFFANVLITNPYHLHDFIGYNIETKIVDTRTNKTITSFNTRGSWIIEIKKQIPGIKSWTPEFPQLYKAIFTLSTGGRIHHVAEKKIGFRTVKVKQRDGIYVNGVKVKMKGVNRHSFWPTSGRTTSKKLSIEDVLLMKDMNMNAVRMSHYPPDDHFLDACDSLGLFVMDELAGWHSHYDTPTGAKLVQEMLAHDSDHPSIIFWANGNEGGHNFELDSLFIKYDMQERPVVHPWQLFGGIETQHYREYNYGIGNYEHGREIVMPTEFLHGQFDGGHGAGLEDYWEKMWRDPLSAGGFLWDFADQGVVRKDKNDSLDTDKHRGADGIVGPYHQKEGSYYAIKEIWSPIYFERKEITEGFDGKLSIQNRYFYTNINQCSFSWKLAKLKTPFTNDTSSITGSVRIKPDIKPGAQGVLQLNLPADWRNYDALCVTAGGVDDKEIFTWSWPLKRPSINETVVKGPGSVYPDVNMFIPDAQTQLLRVENGNREFFFSRQDGWFLGTKNNAVSFGTGPALCEGFAEADTVIYYKDGVNMVIETKYKNKSLIHSLVWTIYPSGWMKMELKYFPSGYFSSMAGVNFSFPADSIKGVQYMGNGPYRVWKNRMKGTQFGVWNKTYNNTETGEAPWIYPEFKGYYANMYWCKFITTGKPFTVVTENENLFLRLYTPVWKTDQWHNYEPVFPQGDISFMQGIPGIGSKTQRNETTGPMGMKNIFYDYEKDPSRALKMVLYFYFFVKE